MTERKVIPFEKPAPRYEMPTKASLEDSIKKAVAVLQSQCIHSKALRMNIESHYIAITEARLRRELEAQE